jgi:hypothetical protein
MPARKYNLRNKLLSSKQCGCFHCLELFPPTEINEWLGPDSDPSDALCPYCGIDSVLGDSEYPELSVEFLSRRGRDRGTFGPEPTPEAPKE